MFFLVDAFSSEPFLGNPAGVCVLDDVDILDSKTMQKIAAYFNWSEISFISKIADDKYRLRWFSPLDEAPLCGHATLAASHIVFSNGMNLGNRVEFVYNSGSLYVERNNNDGLITMSFPLVPIKLCCENSIPFNVFDIIGIEEYEEVLTDGLLYVVVLKNHNDVKNSVPNFCEIKKIDARAIVVTSKGFGEYDFCSRYFAPKVGLYEDPVCGSAHCRLSYHWGKFLNKTTMTAFQLSKRTGILKLEIKDGDCGGRVHISGKAVTVAQFSNPSSFILI